MIRRLLVVVLLCPSAWAATYHVAQGDPGASDANAGSLEAPWRSIQRAAEQLEAGDRVLVHEGVYREYVLPKHSGRLGAPITYEAAEGEAVIITGADTLTQWRRVPGSDPIWETDWTARFVIDTRDGQPVMHHPGDEEHRRSGRAEQLVVDGVAWDWPQLVLTREEMAPGTFLPDPDAGRLLLWLPDGSDPSEHAIEGATRGMLFGANEWMAWARFDWVTVRGFTFRHGASFPQRATVSLYGRGNVLEDCVVEWMSGGGVFVGPEGGTLRRCVIRNCGHTGGCAGGRDFINERVLWEGNCRKPISRGWDAGGVKLVLSSHGLFDRCTFRGNGGPGLWFDIDVRDTVVRGCLFERNEQHGMFVEISRDITIEDCVFLANALEDEGWSVAGLTLAESRHCTVVHNLLAGNRDGISMREQGPRYLDTDDLGRVGFLNTGHVIAGNVCAANLRYQLGLWYDTAFVGMHPGERGQYADEDAFAETVQRESPDRWFDPLAMGNLVDRNLCWQGNVGKLYLYGVTWRVRGREYDDPADFAAATGMQALGVVADPELRPTGDGRWELPTDGAWFAAGFGPRTRLDVP